MSTRQTARPSLLDSLYLLQESSLPKRLNSIPRGKEERAGNGLEEPRV
jgi:hypothetical protein